MPRLEKTHLIYMLPDDGFMWFSLRGGKYFLDNKLSREITTAFKTLLPGFNTYEVERAILKMFTAAVDAINGPLTCTAEEFWAEVKNHVVWHRDLEPRTILLFSWKVISAQVAADELYKHEFEMETGRSWDDDNPVPHTEAAQAVVNFGIKLFYSETAFEIRNKLVPSWTCDTRNEGDQRSTEAAFQQALEKSRLSKEALKVNEANDVGEDFGENECGDDIEMMEEDENEDVEMGHTLEGLVENMEELTVGETVF